MSAELDQRISPGDNFVEISLGLPDTERLLFTSQAKRDFSHAQQLTDSLTIPLQVSALSHLGSRLAEIGRPTTNIITRLSAIADTASDIGVANQAIEGAQTIAMETLGYKISSQEFSTSKKFAEQALQQPLSRPLFESHALRYTARLENALGVNPRQTLAQAASVLDQETHSSDLSELDVMEHAEGIQYLASVTAELGCISEARLLVGKLQQIEQIVDEDLRPYVIAEQITALSNIAAIEAALGLQVNEQNNQCVQIVDKVVTILDQRGYSQEVAFDWLRGNNPLVGNPANAILNGQENDVINAAHSFVAD